MKKKKILRKFKKRESTKKEENPVYIKINKKEFFDSKSDTLTCEMALIKIIKAMKRYSLLREGEMKLRISLQRQIKDVNENIKNIEINLPKVEYHKSRERKTQEKEQMIEYYNQDLETQLEKIRRKLEEIGR